MRDPGDLASERQVATIRVHAIDGTYELFRHHFGQPSHKARDGSEAAAVRGVLTSIATMLATGATHIGVATDHVVESFRNDLWPGYKTSEGMPAELLAQFELLEESLVAMGTVVWPMIELEADDALASVAAAAQADRRVVQVLLCTPDKDLAQCVDGDRVVQLDRRSGVVSDEEAVREKFGVSPRSIPDWLALVGDSADGFPGLAGWGRRSASVVLARYEKLDAVPDHVGDWDPSVRRQVRGASRLAERLADERHLALLFRDLATLRVDQTLVADVESLRWMGPAPEFEEICRALRDPGLAERVVALGAQRAEGRAPPPAPKTSASSAGTGVSS